MKYGRCWKCGAVCRSENLNFTCPAIMPVRIAGICGGDFSEITKEEYLEIIKNWPNAE